MGREVVRRESPHILGKRSRLWHHQDALEVLIGNKGTDEIRGIMLHSPELVNAPLHPDVFKRMKNLKILLVDNINICEAIQYLPNGIRILYWPKYPFRLPSKYYPRELVGLSMPYSRIGLEKLCKQEFQLENMKHLNLSGNCPLLDYESPSGLLNQVIEIMGILPNGVCGSARSNELMDPHFTDYFPSDTEGTESEDGDISHFSNSRFLLVSGTEIPWFNHQSVIVLGWSQISKIGRLYCF
ncbi:hypothetical protein CMV_020436 [Castanea mollissima]|nr:hypothetical protein CMV_020436 [Castanea mollissima]